MDPKENKKSNKKKYLFTAIIVILAIAGIVFGIFQYMNYSKEKEEKTLAYTDLITKIKEDSVEKIEMKEKSTTVKVKLKDQDEEKEVKVPESEAFIEFVQDQVKEGKTINLNQKEENLLAVVGEKLLSFLPTIMLIVLLVMIMQMQGLGDKGKVYDATTQKTKTTFKDIAGLDEEKQEMIEIVDFLKKPKKFQEMGAKIPRGVLLCGNPGTGKTLIAKAIAGEADVPFISMSGSEFIEMFAGLGASRVRKLFEKARKIAPCIVFIDEIDAIGSRRTTSSGSESENNQTLNQLLVEMDGFDTEEAIIVLAATNRPEMLDKALLRPGRFDRQITVSLPDAKGREEILEVHAKDKILASDVNLANIAKRTVGFSGADLENLLNEAALLAVRRNKDSITMAEIDEAHDRVIAGPAKKSHKYTEHEKKVVAFHEAGHAVVGIKLDGANDVQKITIIPRGMAGGYNLMLPKEETYMSTKKELLETISGFLGGRVAEEIVFNEVTTGAHNDFEKATKIARSMVTEYGMSSLGPVQLEHQESSVFLGRDYNKSKNFSDAVALEIDQEVRKIISEQYEVTKKIISENMDLLNLIANALLEHETITKEQIDYLVKYGKMPEEDSKETDATLKELKEEAKELGIKGYSKLNKEELEKEINDKKEEK